MPWREAACPDFLAAHRLDFYGRGLPISLWGAVRTKSKSGNVYCSRHRARRWDVIPLRYTGRRGIHRRRLSGSFDNPHVPGRFAVSDGFGKCTEQALKSSTEEGKLRASESRERTLQRFADFAGQGIVPEELTPPLHCG